MTVYTKRNGGGSPLTQSIAISSSNTVRPLKQTRSRCKPAIYVDGRWSHDTSSDVLAVGGSNRRSGGKHHSGGRAEHSLRDGCNCFRLHAAQPALHSETNWHLSRSSPASRVTSKILVKHKEEVCSNLVGYAAQSEEFRLKEESGAHKHPPLPSHRGRVSAQYAMTKIHK